MKKLLFAVMLLFTSAVAFSQSLAALDEKNGFRDVVLGTDISSYPEMKLDAVLPDGVTKRYKRPTDKLMAGTYPIKVIYYFFYKGKLHTVKLVTEGQANNWGVRMLFESLYGAATCERKEETETCEWVGQKARITKIESGFADDVSAHIMIVSKPLEAQQAADEFKKAQSDL